MFKNLFKKIALLMTIIVFLQTPICAQLLLQDSFSCGDDSRQSGSLLNQLRLEVDHIGLETATQWNGAGRFVLNAKGCVQSDESASATIQILDATTALAQPLQMTANVNPGQSDWVGVVMGKTKMHVDVFKLNEILLILRPSGRYALLIQGTKTQIAVGEASVFNAGDMNKLSLVYFLNDNSVSAVINGVTVVNRQPLSKYDFHPVIKEVGFYAHKKKLPARVRVDDFRVEYLKPDGKPVASNLRCLTDPIEQFFIEPDVQSALTLHVADKAKPVMPSFLDYTVFDYEQRIVQTGQASMTPDGVMQAKIKLPAGYYTLQIEPNGQSFGVASIQTFTGKPDPFFCVDSALSWLVTDKKYNNAYPDFNQSRWSLIQILKRSGIAMSRERLGWNHIQKAANQWDWQTPSHYQSLRNMYEQAGVPVLEMFHNAPAFMGITTGGKYPKDLIAAADAWPMIIKKLGASWGAMELWNEPDISFGGNRPADQYAPLAKSMSYAMTQAGFDGPIGGAGVAAASDRHFLKNLADNGVLSCLDYYSFHTYSFAPVIEKLVQDNRDLLAQYNEASIPLWITECGRPWTLGHDRPAVSQGMLSALDNVMKAVEGKACGVTRHFVFVYPYYEEKSRNFGMMGRLGTPLRPMVAYAQSIKLLAGMDYLGDWQTDDNSLVRARVFGNKQQAVVVFYTGKVNAAQTLSIQLPDSAEIFGIDGRVLSRKQKTTCPIPDGLVYCRMSRDEALPHLITNTSAMQLYKLAQTPRKAIVERSPIVMQFMPDEDHFDIDVKGYRLKADAQDTNFSLPVRIMNLDTMAHQANLQLTHDGANFLKPQRVHLPARQSTNVQWYVPASILKQQLQTQLGVKAVSPNDHHIQPIAMKFLGDVPFATLIKSFSRKQQIQIDDQNRWTMVIADHSQGQMNYPAPGYWRMDAQFDHKKSELWAYPRYKLSPEIQLKDYQGIVVELRGQNARAIRMFLWETDAQSGKEDVGYLTITPMATGDDQWHTIYVPYSELTLSGSNGIDMNSHLDLEQVTSISLGINGQAGDNRLEVRQLWLVGK